MPSIKPHGYWSDLVNIIRETKKAARMLRHPLLMPSEGELRDRRMSSLAMAITNNGGFPRFAEQCGLFSRRIPNGHYDKIQVVIKELRTIASHLRTPRLMPTSTQLRSKRLYSLMAAIARHGGFATVAKIAGLKMSHDKKPPGHYDNYEHVSKEILEAIRASKRFGQMPSSKDLQLAKRSGLVVGVIRHGGFFKVATSLGLKPSRMPNGYWTDETITQHIVSFVNDYGEQGVFPTGSELRLHDHADLDVAITRHGGAYKFAVLLNLEVTKGRKQGAWEEPGTLDREVHAFIKLFKKAGQMPTQADFKRHGRSDLNNALFRYGGGHVAFAVRHGLKLNERPKGYWRRFSNLRKELVEFNKHFGHAGQMPSSPQLRDADYSRLDSAISNVWDGYFSVAERLGWSSVNASLWPRSEIELQIAHELNAVVSFDIDRHDVVVNRENVKQTLDCDIVVPALRLVVEFDSWRWHSGFTLRGDAKFDKDKLKSQLLQRAGWTVVRIREAPLELTHIHDVAVAQTGLKSISNAVVRRICQVTSLRVTSRPVSKYLASPHACRSDVCQQYIAELLKRRRGRSKHAGKPKR